ncbi:uncharacterized protein LOC128215412 [Mya arenaria]|uniref:uncharacterized protein LOC128215412 n=1 Tax=Mya arenaria TaxID=6604 RepID=UPI0022E2C145|nr:uncharacterized protein LOC128215412 [Mya arenaria]
MAGGWLRVVQKVFMAIFSLTHAINSLGNGVVLPKDPYIYIGNILTLMCNLTTYEPGDYDSQNLFFSRRNDEIIASTYITIESTRSIVLRYPIRSSEDGGNYLCKLNRRNNRPEIIGNQFVVVEYEPQPVTDVNCRVYNWQNMTCTWDLGVKYVHPDTIDVSLIWTIDSTQSVCPHPTKTSCSWWEVDEENSFMSDLPYYMGVIVTNKRTGIRYPESVPGQSVDTNRIVEPTPVQDLAAEKNTTCIMLSWKHRKIRRDKVYKLDFKSEHDMYWQKEAFPNEYSALLSEKPVPSRSKVVSLNAVLDENGCEEIREVEKDCRKCRLLKSRTSQQIMAPLPKQRTEKTLRAFAYTSVDYGGPFLTKEEFQSTVLTPNHFLHGQLGEFAPEEAEDIVYDHKKRWHRVQEIVNHFWKRWFKEILPAIGSRKKWFQEKDNLSVGDDVLIVDPDQPRGCWRLGRVGDTYPEVNGRVRVASVRVGESINERPITPLCPIEKCA